MFACLASHRSAEPNTLVVRMDFDERDGLIAAEPKTYYLTDHYVDYPCVLVRLTRVRHDALRDLLLMGWGFVSAAKSRRLRNGDASNSPAFLFLWYSRSVYAKEFDGAESDAAFVSGRGRTSK